MRSKSRHILYPLTSVANRHSHRANYSLSAHGHHAASDHSRDDLTSPRSFTREVEVPAHDSESPARGPRRSKTCTDKRSAEFAQPHQNVDQSRANQRRTLDEPNSAFCSARSCEAFSNDPDGAAPGVNVTSTLAT
jgi:hypothetical protein